LSASWLTCGEFVTGTAVKPVTPTQAEHPEAGSQGWQPVARSNPIKGELMTPRISIMSVPGRTLIGPFKDTTCVPAGTLS